MSQPLSDPSTETEPVRKSTLAYNLDILGKRRRFLINRKAQLRTVFMTSSLVLVLLVMLNITLHNARQKSAAIAIANAPELAVLIHSQNRLELSLVIVASIVFLAGVFVVTLLETHKTEGAAFNIGRHLQRLAEGEWATRLHLRKDDNLRALEIDFNRLAGALQSRALAEREVLERLASEVERITTPGEAREISLRIREHAEDIHG